jgi:hypothetical protein
LSTLLDGGAPDEVNPHGPAGKGTSWLGEEDEQEGSAVPGQDNPSLQRVVMPLPVGFFNAILARRICSSEVDYLPQVPNLPQARNVGRVKPRCISQDWLAIGFDPWSAGRKPLNIEFVESLSSKAEKLFPEVSPVVAHENLENLKDRVGRDNFTTVEDSEGIQVQRQEINKAQLISNDFDKISSLIRHGKYIDVENLLNGADWNVPIDFQDLQGNTLVHIAAQNGSKRLIKLCMRRGANLNAQNVNGQTALHFAFGYGYNDLGDYLCGKGADDNIRNTDNLTCYEGLGAAELALL